MIAGPVRYHGHWLDPAAVKHQRWEDQMAMVGVNIVKVIERYATSHIHSFFLAIIQYHVYAKLRHKQKKSNSNHRNKSSAKIGGLPIKQAKLSNCAL